MAANILGISTIDWTGIVFPFPYRPPFAMRVAFSLQLTISYGIMRGLGTPARLDGRAAQPIPWESSRFRDTNQSERRMNYWCCTRQSP